MRKSAWMVWLPIIAVPLLLFAIPLVQGKVIYWGTAGLQFIPWREFAYVQLDHGELPLWNPLNGMGAPLIANYQLAFFYPPGWLTYLGHWLAGASGVAWVYTLLVPIHLAWGGLGMAALVRSLGVKPLGQAISGLAFAMTGYFVARASFFSMVWTGAWMGWILWAASGIASPFSSEKSMKCAIWLPWFTGLMLLAGHAQLSWYILLFACVWTIGGALLVSGFRRAVGAGMVFAGLILAGVLIAGIQLAPTLEYLLQSQRADSYEYSQAMTYSYWPWRLLTFLNPELFGNPGLGDYWGYGAYWEDAGYIGLIPFFLALGGIGRIFKKEWVQYRKGLVFLCGLALIGFVLALGSHLPLFPWLYRHVPTFDLFQAPARWMVWPVAVLCILAGFSADAWRRPEGRSLKWTRLGVAGFTSVFIGAGLAIPLLSELKPGLMRGFMVMGLLGAVYCLVYLKKPSDETSHRHYIWNAIVLIIISLDLVAANIYLNPFIPSNFFRSNGLSDGTGKSQGGRIFISSADEYELKFKKYLRFSDTRYTADFNDIRRDLLPNLNLLYGIDSANNFDPLVPERYDTWIKMLNEMDPNERIPYLAFMGVERIFQLADGGQANITNLPTLADDLIEIFPCVQTVSDGEEALSATIERITRGGTPACIILESSGVPFAKAYVEEAQITSVKSGYRSVEFRIDSEEPVWVRIGITWYPGWEAQIDGSQTRLYRADYLYGAIEAPAGSHSVTIQYRPSSLIIGAGLTVTGVILAFLFGLLWNRKTNRGSSNDPSASD